MYWHIVVVTDSGHSFVVPVFAILCTIMCTWSIPKFETKQAKKQNLTPQYGHSMFVAPVAAIRMNLDASTAVHSGMRAMDTRRIIPRYTQLTRHIVNDDNIQGRM